MGWNTARPRADLVGEAEQVELDAELAVVALGRLLEPVRGASSSAFFEAHAVP